MPNTWLTPQFTMVSTITFTTIHKAMTLSSAAT